MAFFLSGLSFILSGCEQQSSPEAALSPEAYRVSTYQLETIDGLLPADLPETRLHIVGETIYMLPVGRLHIKHTPILWGNLANAESTLSVRQHGHRYSRLVCAYEDQALYQQIIWVSYKRSL